MNYIQTIITAIARRFGLELQQIPAPSTFKYSDLSGVNLTAIAANKIATLAFQDSKIYIEGNSARAQWFRDFVENYAEERWPVAGEVALGTGDGIMRPYTDGKRYGLDIISNQDGDFRVCESIGNDILACVLKTGEIKDDNGTVYQRFEVQMVRDAVTESGQETSAVLVYNLFYRNDTEISKNDAKFPAAWRDLPDSYIIPNYSKPLFGRIKSPTVDRLNVNGANGVEITHGADKAMKHAVDAYERFNREYRAKQTKVFADKTLFRKEIKDGNERYILPDNDTTYMMMRGGDAGIGSRIQEYSPALQGDQHELAIQVDLRMVEMCIGLSYGILSRSELRYTNTDEIRASLNQTFAYITAFRKAVQKGVRDALDAIDALMNMNDTVPVGDWEVKFDWSYGFIESMTQTFNQLTMAEGIGAVAKWEVRQYLTDEDEPTARAAVEQINEETGADLMEEVTQDEQAVI